MYNHNLTPIERVGDIWVKREDKFEFAGQKGAKVRAALSFFQDNPKGVTTAGSRHSPQINIIASIASELNVPFVAHTPTGKLSEEVKLAQEKGATIEQHQYGYNNVIKARAREFANQSGYLEVPFGMISETSVELTANQVQNLPSGIKRIVVPVGSGVCLSGVLHGLLQQQINIPVLGIQVGANPNRTLNAFAPFGWQGMCEIVKSPLEYSTYVSDCNYEGIELDPIYEAKCIPFLQPDDLFWIVGKRESSVPIKKKSRRVNVVSR